jgi:hypothetical protein
MKRLPRPTYRSVHGDVTHLFGGREFAVGDVHEVLAARQ